MEKPIVVIINGSIASGKTSVALKLAQTWEKGVHLDVDIIRNFIKGGFIEEDELYVSGENVIERFKLKALAIRITTLMVRAYLQAGYSVFISDPIYLKELENMYRSAFDALKDTKTYYIYLQADFNELLKRVRTRSSQQDEPDKKIHHYTDLFALFDTSHWNIINTEGLNKEEVFEKVKEII